MPKNPIAGLATGAAVELLFLSSVWLLVVAWLIARAFGQRDLLSVVTPSAPAMHDVPSVAIIIPARDEAANIGRCLDGIAAQTHPASRLKIIVVDDHSADGTFALAAAVAAKHSRISVLRSPSLPPGWVGKSHACWIGARAAGEDSDWLCFLDADVWAKPALVASALAVAGAHDLDLLSLAPRQELESFAERLVMPCGLYLLAFCQDLRTVQAPDSDEATATGQFMLIRRAAYEAVGGHAAVHRAICEDLMLARAVKRSGRRVLLADGRRLLATRMYTGWPTLWVGISKNLSEMLGGPWRTVAFALAAVTLAWAAILLPVADAANGYAGSALAWRALGAATLGSAAAFGLHIAGAAYFRIPFWYGLLFPLGYSAGAAIAADSIRRRLRGRITWKGRAYS